ncbi:DUF1877 family protein [Streptomyces sp. NPDC058084]|uniref:DUF1877 family protein n=1 Tax=Streptomyces sp. NPDC058084 TaxID=3346333 RepID=UPI0036E7B250
MHLHLRAAAETDLRDDHVWLTAFMGTAWENHEVECAAGVSDSVEKDFRTLHELYEASGESDAWLPVFGGRQPAGAPSDRLAHPPLMLLTPDETVRAAAFLTSVSFDDLWSRAGAGIHASFGPGWPETTVREIFRTHHRDLRAFYARAAASGHTVLKAGWF